MLRLSVDLGPDAMTASNLPGVFSPDEARLVFPVRGRMATSSLQRGFWIDP